MMNPKVDEYFIKAKKWQTEMQALRTILLATDLTEELKWGEPCYTLGKANVVLIHGFKEYCALLFFKGALLKDPKGILIQQTQNVQAARQVRFTDIQQIATLAPTLKTYIKEAIKVEQAGLKVEYKKTEEFAIPEELEQVFAKSPGLRKAFEDLTPGRQRAYILHFSAAKQSKTRVARIEKAMPQILAGKGLND
jgi:uncharacterized protein YdeI (YjbR/CyaY-like superfamily)